MLHLIENDEACKWKEPTGKRGVKREWKTDWEKERKTERKKERVLRQDSDKDGN